MKLKEHNESYMIAFGRRKGNEKNDVAIILKRKM